jgi:hypothetical protein
MEVTLATTELVAESPEQRQEVADTCQAPTPASGPSSLAFTIDFGHEDGKPQITDRWTHPTPFRGHAGMQRRSAVTKTKSFNKEQTTISGDKVKSVKVRLSELNMHRYTSLELFLETSVTFLNFSANSSCTR